MAQCLNPRCPGKKPNLNSPPREAIAGRCGYCGHRLDRIPAPIMPTRRVDPPSDSFEAAFRAYQRANPNMRTPIGRRIGSLDVYPLILKELKKAFEAAKRDFILYGSAALWLEGCPRPDLSPRQTIKDLDMGTFAADAKETEQAILKLVRGTIAGSVIDWGNVNHVFTSNQGTMEFVAADEGVQFSFSLQNLEGWSALSKISKPRRLPGTQVRILATGLEYIASGLGGEGGMFDRTLFRSDKTLKILTYACLCLGYEALKSRNIVQEFVKRFAEADANEMKKQLSNISVDRHSKKATEFHGQTKPLVDKLDSLKTFRAPLTLSDSQRKVETELAESLDSIVKARLSRDERMARIEENVKKKVDTLKKTKPEKWEPSKVSSRV
ncbi:hypothetical protein MYSTI_01721 [Myxococcus stipitatus DSM 14675]|uniref:Uncharacterized protein n=2 Tax=Myxococcus stipitatus TaxID=83455 RepID=L7U4H0_MYXSD|nr:hypothetical protein MYSTI_01721 [Myxococcus stipitatus DSM 14675]